MRRLILCLLVAAAWSPSIALARYYDPGTGQFLSEDPAARSPVKIIELARLMEPMRMAKFLYAMANPLRYTDPSGMDPPQISPREYAIIGELQRAQVYGVQVGIGTAPLQSVDQPWYLTLLQQNYRRNSNLDTFNAQRQLAERNQVMQSLGQGYQTPYESISEGVIAGASFTPPQLPAGTQIPPVYQLQAGAGFSVEQARMLTRVAQSQTALKQQSYVLGYAYGALGAFASMGVGEESYPVLAGAGPEIRIIESRVLAGATREVPVGAPVVRSLRELPEAASGTTRVFRGTGHPNVQQVGLEYRANPAAAPSGAKQFLTESEAKMHAFGGRPDPSAVSATTDFGTARQYTKGPGAGTVVYDVPQSVYSQLPKPNPVQGEVVFSGSIPDEFRIGVVK